MTVERIVAANRAFVERFPGEAQARPRRHLAVVACMDARIDVAASLGIVPGDAHILRNAGGIVTDDVIRSLSLSQRALGTRSILVIQHTDCGLEGIDDEAFLTDLEAEAGRRPGWDPGGFTRIEESVRASVRRLRESPFLPHREDVSGFVYSTGTGELRPVDPAV